METAEEPPADTLRCMRVKHKTGNEIIPSVKRSKLWTDAAIIFTKRGMTAAQERQWSITYVLISSDMSEHV